MFKVLTKDLFWEKMLPPVTFNTYEEAVEYMESQMEIWEEDRGYKIVEEEAD